MIYCNSGAQKFETHLMGLGKSRAAFPPGGSRGESFPFPAPSGCLLSLVHGHVTPASASVVIISDSEPPPYKDPCDDIGPTASSSEFQAPGSQALTGFDSEGNLLVHPSED